MNETGFPVYQCEEWQCRYVFPDKRCCVRPKDHDGEHAAGVVPSPQPLFSPNELALIASVMGDAGNDAAESEDVDCRDGAQLLYSVSRKAALAVPQGHVVSCVEEHRALSAGVVPSPPPQKQEEMKEDQSRVDSQRSLPSTGSTASEDGGEQ